MNGVMTLVRACAVVAAMGALVVLALAFPGAVFGLDAIALLFASLGPAMRHSDGLTVAGLAGGMACFSVVAVAALVDASRQERRGRGAPPQSGRRGR